MNSVDELSIERWEEGELVIKQLKKEVITKGAWATVLYLCQDMDPKTKTYKAPNARIVRYRKMKGVYKPQSHFTISNAKQAMEIARILENWFSAEAKQNPTPKEIFEEESDK